MKTPQAAIALITFVAGVFTSSLAIPGYIDASRSYCNPPFCYTVPSWYKVNVPPQATYNPGEGRKVPLAISGLLLFSSAYLASRKALKEFQILAEEENFQNELAQAQTEIQLDEEAQKMAFAASKRVDIFKKSFSRAIAAEFIQKNPDLVEVLAEVQEKQDDITPPQYQLSKGNKLEVEEAKEDAPQMLGGLDERSLPFTPITGDVAWWDWRWFRDRIDDLPHIRIVAPTNGGKTTLADWLIDVIPHEERYVLTIKRKRHQWQGLEVIGVPEDYDAISDRLTIMESERKKRISELEDGTEGKPQLIAVDEWRKIAKKVSGAVEIMGDMLTIAREANQRILALAQGRQVKTWGLEGESDLEDCFASVYLGVFAHEEAKAARNKYAKDSEEFKLWDEIYKTLKNAGKRAAWVVCEFGIFPAIAPDLKNWNRVKEVTTPQKTEEPTQELPDLDIRTRLELLWEQTAEAPDPVDEVDEDEPTEDDTEELQELSDLALFVIRIIKSARKYPISFEAIRKSTKWEEWTGEKPNSRALRNAIEELIECEEVSGDESQGYTGL